MCCGIRQLHDRGGSIGIECSQHHCSCIRHSDSRVAVGGQPRICWSDWKDQNRWNRDCRRYLRGMIRTSTFRICVAVMQLQNNYTFQTILCPEFPRQWPSASAQCMRQGDFQMPRFIRQEMHSTPPRLQRATNTASDTPAECASSAVRTHDLLTVVFVIGSGSFDYAARR